MKAIFLSASVPLPHRDERFRQTVDVVAIRDAVRALAQACSKEYLLVFGGHPAITPLLRHQMQIDDARVPDHFVVYQSLYFEKQFLSDIHSFERVVYTDNVAGDIQASLGLMRTRMLTEHTFSSAFFIGGMEGIFDEYRLFTEKWPGVATFPIASTGAAARILFDEEPNRWPKDLLSDMKYLSLFRRLLETKNEEDQRGT